jgi:hypothetical protein
MMPPIFSSSSWGEVDVLEDPAWFQPGAEYPRITALEKGFFHQGDQMKQIFASWASVWLENQRILGPFFSQKNYIHINFDK